MTGHHSLFFFGPRNRQQQNPSKANSEATVSCSEGGGPGDPMDGKGAGGLETGSGPKSTESRDENDGEIWSGGEEWSEVLPRLAVMFCVARKHRLLSSGHCTQTGQANWLWHGWSLSAQQDVHRRQSSQSLKGNLHGRVSKLGQAAVCRQAKCWQCSK